MWLSNLDRAIIDAVEEDKPVTLRGVFYRVVSAGAVDKTEVGYSKVQRELLKLRRAGEIDYEDIVDGTRAVTKRGSWNSLGEMLRSQIHHYRRDPWEYQDCEVYIFSEKDAITSVIESVCDRWDVPLGISRGYSSETFAWSCAQQFIETPRTVFVYQLGDHDPSGADIPRSFEERVRGFMGGLDMFDDGRPSIHFARLAVTQEQITELGLPTRPTKGRDTRAAKFSGESVEVDAIRAPVLRQIVEDAITSHIDPDAYEEARADTEADRARLREIAETGD